ncbi:hypothetical protein CEXT_726921 [Caerostris extrusa]|uniref:Uncharacterized protein n=1 Tax=Caerostris extrusa TaxID=172846 RepID=A0AAV4NS05_CAEEX|nr:hypothetical protein CEXT_726921 [Caerostris extrusa]
MFYVQDNYKFYLDNCEDLCVFPTIRWQRIMFGKLSYGTITFTLDTIFQNITNNSTIQNPELLTQDSSFHENALLIFENASTSNNMGETKNGVLVLYVIRVLTLLIPSSSLNIYAYTSWYRKISI